MLVVWCTVFDREVSYIRRVHPTGMRCSEKLLRLARLELAGEPSRFIVAKQVKRLEHREPQGA